MFHDGTASDNVHYYDLCKVVNHANIAYNRQGQFGRISKKTNNLVEKIPRPWKKYQDVMPRENAIAEFVRQNNIMATWINCNQVFGYFDKELGNTIYRQKSAKAGGACSLF